MPHSTPMDKPYWYEIRVEGQLADRWSDWFDGLMVDSDANNQTTLSGWISDQSALLGVLTRIHNLNLSLLAVSRSAHQPKD